MKERFLLGIDLGSSACKVTFLNAELLYKGTGLQGSETYSSEYKTYYPRPGWAEQDSRDWIKAVVLLIRKGIEKQSLKPEQIIMVGLSGVTHSPVLLDEDFKAIGNVIHITDSRSIKQTIELKKYNDDFMKICFNPVSPMWTISMLKWVYEEEPERWNKIKKILFPKDYLRYMLTGSIATDNVDAEGTLLFDTLKKKWDDRLIDLAKLKRDSLPDILIPDDIAGYITKQGAEWSGLAKGTPVIAGTTDTLLEILAAGNQKNGDCTVKLATFGRICVLTEKAFPMEGIINYSYIIPGLWYPGTGTKSCASSYRWLKEELYKDFSIKSADNIPGPDSTIDAGGKIKNNQANIFKEMDKKAAEIDAGSDGLIFHPYLLGEGSPYNDPKLRGDFLGVTLHHKREHFTRAVLEGTSFSLLDSIEFIKNTGISIKDPVKIIGGGAKSSLWVKIVADILGHDVIVPQNTDASFGAALLAGKTAGLFSSIESAAKFSDSSSKTINTCSKTHARYKKLYDIYKKAKIALTEINHELSGF